MMSCILFSTSTLFIQNVESLTNEHIHSHILHTVKLLKIRNLLSKNGPMLILVTAIYIVI